MAEQSSEDEDYQQAAHSTADYADYRPPQKTRNPIWRKIGTGLVILAVIAGLAAAGYWYLKNQRQAKPAQTSQNQQKKTNDAQKISAETEHFNSVNFNLGFDYPADWKVDDSGNGILTARSQAIELLDESGQPVPAQITMTIRQKGQKIAQFDGDSAATVLDSEKIAYIQPSENQRANTYLSFISYSGLAGGLEAVYVTGDSGYKKAQAVPRADIEGGDPIIGITFAKCRNDTCTGGTEPLAISPDNWDDQAFSRPLKAMLQSLSVI